MISVTPILAFDDNYIWLIKSPDSRHCYVVDPGDAQPVIAYLTEHQLELTGILITHHHHDHTGGIAQLQQHFNQMLKVYGPASENIAGITDNITQATSAITLEGVNTPVAIFHLPGHTLGHIAYHIGSHLFCGDTLFSGGCGRLFEGTPEQMLSSLTLLAQLDGDTLVYPAHEYTLANLRFALTVDPSNSALQTYVQQAQQYRAVNRPTLPTTIAHEKAINPFLRTDDPKIQQSLNKQFQQPIQDKTISFTLLRQWKDNF
ncbi:hydroxyacylglutathione hydrolase [Shewanella algidipiscicola]|uniref:Hydroxyacylglutathione hydrolase n=1 Tax=Shewanella algidipiscicola TaxID=614070 RepID=A0ABQ4NTB6_9GAMM|nr:hydroxyacylglutathione hydrolase [Shewanella algidipiscicola]GIU02848.1 hydroxyacylglutathione hydrolase [Shewanella algidipiscicola]